MLKVLVPNVPTADAVLPYLRRIDEARVYVNSGPLVAELESRLRARTGAPAVACVANGTLALELALRALGMPPRSEVLVPSVTFKASGQAIVNAGHVPVLADVDSATWQLRPDEAAAAIAGRPSIRCVMPVAAFGLPVPAAGWEDFADAHRCHVLIDAAGALLEQRVPDHRSILVAYSLHATKAVGCGEGGAVAGCSTALVRRVAELAAFGPGGTNAKMSEYHAAVALAALDPARLAAKAAAVASLHRWYAPLPLARQAGQQEFRTLLPVLMPSSVDLCRVMSAFAHAGIEVKRWYWPLLHELDEFDACPRAEELPVAQMLADRLLGLPFHDFMTEADVAHVLSTLEGALQP